MILPILSDVRFLQGKLLGRLNDIGFEHMAETETNTLVTEIIASSQTEGIILDAEKVRLSVARRLGLEQQAPHLDTHDVDGAVDITIDAAKNYTQPITHERLFSWHGALFPTGWSGLHKIQVGQYRKNAMQVVSGAIGKEKIHYEAPAYEQVQGLMETFIVWLNDDAVFEPIIKAGLAHVWFLVIHPFEDGNGRIARALTELLLARSDKSPRRFYSMSEQILVNRTEYYNVLEQTQKGTTDITAWLTWFLGTLGKAIEQSINSIDDVIERAKFWHNLEGITLNVRQKTILGKLKNGFKGKLTTSKWAKICKVSSDTALRDIKDLLDKGILEQDASGGRSTSYSLRNIK